MVLPKWYFYLQMAMLFLADKDTVLESVMFTIEFRIL